MAGPVSNHRPVAPWFELSNRQSSAILQLFWDNYFLNKSIGRRAKEWSKPTSGAPPRVRLTFQASWRVVAYSRHIHRPRQSAPIMKELSELSKICTQCACAYNGISKSHLAGSDLTLWEVSRNVHNASCVGGWQILKRSLIATANLEIVTIVSFVLIDMYSRVSGRFWALLAFG